MKVGSKLVVSSLSETLYEFLIKKNMFLLMIFLFPKNYFSSNIFSNCEYNIIPRFLKSKTSNASRINFNYSSLICVFVAKSRSFKLSSLASNSNS